MKKAVQTDRDAKRKREQERNAMEKNCKELNQLKSSG